MLVGMCHLRVLADDLDLEACFFVAFTDCCLFCGFARFDFAAGKFPVTGQHLVSSARTSQELILVLDDRDVDLLDSRHGNLPYD